MKLEDIHIGEIIKQEINKAGIKTPEISMKLDVTERYMYLIYKKPSIETALLVKLSNIIGVNFFSKFEEEMKPKCRKDLEERKLFSDIYIQGKSNYSFSFLKKSPAIYGILNIQSGKVYIGSTSNIRTRAGVHFNKLKSGYHERKNMQTDFNILGCDNFEIIVFKYCNKEDLSRLGEEFFQAYKENCYNIRIHTQSNKGSKVASKSLIKWT